MGIESTECGAASAFISLASAAAVTCRIMKPEFRPASRTRNAGKLAGLRIGHLLDAALGNSAERGQRDRHLIGGHRQRLAVKISAADHFAGIGEDERIVRGAVHFDRDRRADSARARRARRRAPAERSAGCRDPARADRSSRERCDSRISLPRFSRSRLRAVMACPACGRTLRDARIERRGAAAQRVERKRGGDVGRVDGNFRFAQGQRQEREHCLRAVQQREAFFRFEHKRRDPRGAHRFGAGMLPPL